MRLWLEDGVTPERSAAQYLTHLASATGLAGVWIYQGLVPKLIAVDEGETRFWTRAGAGPANARALVRAVGLAEIAAGVGTLFWHRRPAVLLGTAALMPVLAIGAAVTDRASLSRAFNPVSLNWAMSALAVVAHLTTTGSPSGRSPLRRAPDRQPPVGDLP